MAPLPCARRPLQELLLLLPLRGPGEAVLGMGAMWQGLLGLTGGPGGRGPGEGQGEQGIRHSMLFPGLPS